MLSIWLHRQRLRVWFPVGQPWHVPGPSDSMGSFLTLQFYEHDEYDYINIYINIDIYIPCFKVLKYWMRPLSSLAQSTSSGSVVSQSFKHGAFSCPTLGFYGLNYLPATGALHTPYLPHPTPPQNSSQEEKLSFKEVFIQASARLRPA